MTQKRRRKLSTPPAVERTLEIIHIGYAVAPGIAILLATIFRKDIHLYIELGFIVIVIVVNFYILLKPKTEESKDEKGLSLFYTFLFNAIKPVKISTEQKYEVKIAIVEDENKAYFKERLDKQFHKETDASKRHSVIDAPDDKLVFESIKFDPHETEDIESEVSKFLTDHKLALDRATAVVVVRTDEPERKDESEKNSDELEKYWVYQAVDSWAYQHSEVPILFAKDKSKEYTHHEIADNYLRIPDDPKSLPWRLLQRARQRGKAWRIQAGYNRAMVWNIFYLSLMCIYIGVIWIVAQRNEFNTAYRGLSHAKETRRLFERDVLKRYDDKLHVSYWFKHKDLLSHKGQPTVFVTTEELDTTNAFDTSNESLIGCGFSTPNIIVECKEGCNDKTPKKADVFDIGANPKLDTTCHMSPRPEEPIYSIACITYKPSGLGDEYTVGICIFTGDKDRSILDGDEEHRKSVRNFLWARVDKFYKDFRESIHNGTVTPLAERTSLFH
jgi:hypothetical protein